MVAVVYQPLLIEVPPITNELKMGGGASSARTFSLNISQLNLDPYKILKQRRFLAGFGEISLQINGQMWEDRYVILRGEMESGVRFGSVDEMLDLEIVDPKDINDITIPPLSLTQDLEMSGQEHPPETFADMPDNNIGKHIPLIMNYVPTIPCVRVSTVPSVGPTYNMKWIAYQDPLGQHKLNKAYVDGVEYNSWSADYPYTAGVGSTNGINYEQFIFEVGTGLWEDSTTVYASVRLIDGELGTFDFLVDVIEVIRILCRDWSTVGLGNINESLFSRAQANSAQGLIPSVLINASGAANSATALKYIEDVLCKSYPMITMVWQDGGYGPVYYDRRTPPIMELRKDQAPLLKRRTAITETPKKDLKNRFSIQYDYDAMTDTYRGYSERNATNSEICQISQEQTGTREESRIESKVIGSLSDPMGNNEAIVGSWQADIVLDWLVEHTALPSYYAEYDAFAGVYMMLQLGDNIILYDSDITEDPITATVEKMSYGEGKVVIGLRMWILYDQLQGTNLGALV